MRKRRDTRRRVLAIDPTYRGFGYVVLEGADRLVDWGVCEVRTDKSRVVLEKIAGLIRMFGPDVLIVEDVKHQRCQRRAQARLLLQTIVVMARELTVRVRCIPAATVREYYRKRGATNKDAVARLIVQQFPELAPFLPKRRKAWMPEHAKMAVFDALGMVIAEY